MPDWAGLRECPGSGRPVGGLASQCGHRHGCGLRSGSRHGRWCAGSPGTSGTHCGTPRPGRRPVPGSGRRLDSGARCSRPVQPLVWLALATVSGLMVLAHQRGLLPHRNDFKIRRRRHVGGRLAGTRAGGSRRRGFKRGGDRHSHGDHSPWPPNARRMERQL